uniref:NACHT domain-containing protein n=1 Tax=Bionectria ochroleuca TaxID=29856 RepID=A0A8H7NFB6_BIOOC
METVTAFRSKTQTLSRPIIFIGHSLGGLLIKEALLLSRKKLGESKPTISRATYGIVFFGVPNHGLRNEQLRTLVDGQPNKAFINDLLVDDDSEASGFLKRLASQFAESFKGYYRIITFYERLLSPTLERNKTGGWSRTGRRCLMVTEESATSTGIVATADEDNIPMNADHSGLVKFSSRNHGGYLVVQERLRILIEETKQQVSQRFAEADLYCPSSETHQACSRSLAYEGMDSRLDTIVEESDGTCEWLSSHGNFVKWREQHRGLLWIKGNPGSGKSTIIKYALRRLSKVYGPETQVFSFFFHARGHELQKSLIGFFRSILHQILQRFPGSLNDLVDTFNTKRMSISEPGKNWHWHLQPLQEFLRLGLPKILARFPVVFFIDALDECGQRPALDLVEYFQRVLQCLPSKGRQFGICFSCRHYPIIPGNGGLEVVLEKENHKDICLFVRSRLLISTGDINDELFALIVWRAQGVFLWAVLVVREISRMAIEGESMATMKAEIDRMPPDLNPFYEELVKRSENRPAMLNLIQWICFSQTPMSRSELQWALVVDPKSPLKSFEEYLASENFISSDRFEKRIKTLSCGLVEVDSIRVQFIHQSVKEFFLDQGLALLAQREPNEVVAAAHSRMSLVCVQYLNICGNDRGD